MSTRLILSAAMLLASTVPATPALAQSVLETHADAAGALAGRSPHKAYRPVAQRACRETALHSLPAGKPHVYGTHALRGADCAAAQAVRTAAPIASAVQAAD